MDGLHLQIREAVLQLGESFGQMPSAAKQHVCSLGRPTACFIAQSFWQDGKPAVPMRRHAATAKSFVSAVSLK